MDRVATSRQVLRLADELGFGLAGIAPAVASPHAEHIRRWIAEGRHGQMGYLENHLDIRLDPVRLLEGARSVIVVADRYPSQSPPKPTDSNPRAFGRIARYAWGDDYHKTIKKRLHQLCDALASQYPQAQFRAAVDTAPLLEREHATRAGLGWIGKHTLLIHPRHGSWFLLGGIITTLDLATSEELNYPANTLRPLDHCGTCTRCIDACPTHAIADQGYTLDASKCISYLTLEHRGPIDPALYPHMADWIAGCDICQEVCPHNRDRPAETALPGVAVVPAYTPRNTALSLLDILGWTPEDRQATFTRSALKRVKLDMLKRNALIAAGNALAEHPDSVPRAALQNRIEQIANDPDEPELVRTTAKQVLSFLTANTTFSERVCSSNTTAASRPSDPNSS